MVSTKLHPDFDLPGQGSPISRLSSITGSLVHMLVPWIPPSEAEVDRALDVLGMGRGAQCTCAYCGATRTEWDHLRPLVRNKRPTGYITELANLVPACGKCNQSKSGADWRPWLLEGNSQRHPRSRGASTQDLERRAARLSAFELAFPPHHIDFEALLGAEQWKTYWDHLVAIEEALRRSTSEGERLRAALESTLRNTGVVV